jgi:nitroreductase
MTVNEALKTHLLTRRSVGPAFLAEPGPDEATLEQMLAIATRVPDHGKLTPWRLVVYRGEARAEIGRRLADLVQARTPDVDAATLEAERNRFLPAPLTVGVLSSPIADHPKIPAFEQLLSAGNVAFNLVHSAYAFGFAAQWVTRWYAFDAEAAQILGARAGEQFVGFVHIGTPTIAIEDRPRPALEDVVTFWQG